MNEREIIVYAGGYDLQPGIKVFVKSALESTNATIVVLYKDITNNLKKYLEQQSNVKLVNVVDEFKKYNIDFILSPYTLKVICFYLYTKYHSQASRMLLCDFTDMWFLDDIFSLQSLPGCTVFGEGELIKNCQTNTTWMNVCYNSDIYNLVKKYEIINGGAIYGERVSCIELLNEMVLETSNIIGRIGNYQNIDQAILNKVVRFDEKHVVLGIDNEHTYVLNLAHGQKVFKGDLHKNFDKYDKFGYLFSMDGLNTVSIVHQYDVDKDLTQKLYKRYE